MYTYEFDDATLVTNTDETGNAGEVRNICISNVWKDYVELVSATQNDANIDVVVKAIKAISNDDASNIEVGIIAYQSYDTESSAWKSNSDMFIYEITEPTKYAVTCAECTNGTVSVGDTVSYAEGETVTVIAAAAADYVLDKVTITKTEDSSDVTETVGYDTVAGTFAMPAYAVTVTATYTAGCYLDLDTATTDILDSKDITQTYTFTESGDTKYTDASKVKVEWTVTNISATYTGTKTWNPDEMKWVEAKAVTADDHTAEFKLTNYSSIKVNASVTFKAEDALAATLTSATFKNGDADVTGKTVTLETPVTKDQDTYADSDFTAKAQTVTATLKFDTAEFAKLSEQTDKATYGTYTVKLGAASATPLKLTQTAASKNQFEFPITKNELILSGTTWDEVIEANEDNRITFTVEGTDYVLHLGYYEDTETHVKYVFILTDANDPAVALVKTNTTEIDYDDAKSSGQLIASTDAIPENIYFFVTG